MNRRKLETNNFRLNKNKGQKTSISTHAWPRLPPKKVCPPKLVHITHYFHRGMNLLFSLNFRINLKNSDWYRIGEIKTICLRERRNQFASCSRAKGRGTTTNRYLNANCTHSFMRIVRHLPTYAPLIMLAAQLRSTQTNYLDFKLK